MDFLIQMILQMIKVFKQDTADEAEQILEAGLNKMSELAQQEADAQRESDQKVAEINAANDESEREIKREEILSKEKIAKINAGAKIDVAEIFSEDTRDTTSAKEKSKVYKAKVDSDSKKASQAKSNAQNSVKRWFSN